MKFAIGKILKKISKDEYPLFVSERHLQVAFIIKAKELYPEYQYIPEYVYKENGKDYHIDLLVADSDAECIAFEFKYVVAGGIIKVPGDEQYALRDHSAIDKRKYQCVKDISRLETYVNSKSLKCNKGYFILITNMHGFWDGGKSDSVVAQFDIKHDSLLEKGKHIVTGKGSHVKDYSDPIDIKNNYNIKYSDYVDIGGKYGLFKYLCICVE